jgi:two-component sensor histidine kinase
VSGGAEARLPRRAAWPIAGTSPARHLDRAGDPLESGAAGGLHPARRKMVHLAIWIGFASTLAVVISTLMPHRETRYTHDGAVYVLAALATGANAGFGILALRWRERRAASLLVVWGVALIGFLTTLTYFGGGSASDYYLLYFLAISFIAATQPPLAQACLFALLVAGYTGAVWAVPAHPFTGDLLLRLGVLLGAEVLAWYLASALAAEEAKRARFAAEADLKHVLAVEANHRIKNNLQLIADLLSLEAGKPQASLPNVVDVTLARVQAVAAVHALLAAGGNGQIQIRSVLERVLTLLTERLGTGTPIAVAIEGSLPDLDPQRAAWLAVAVNELATNAIQHGISPNGGRLNLLLEPGTRCRVVLEDDGLGGDGHTEGLGLTLVRRLVEEGLQGEFQISSAGPGTRAEIRFPQAAAEWDR